MTLWEYTLVSVSIASTLLTLVLIVVLVGSVILYRKVSRILMKLEAMSNAGVAASETFREFITTTTAQAKAFIQTFLTYKGAKEIFETVSDTVAKNRKQTREEAEHGQQ